MNLSHPLIKKQVGKRQKTLTWYLLSSVEGEPKYLSEKAEAEGEKGNQRGYMTSATTWELYIKSAAWIFWRIWQISGTGIS